MISFPGVSSLETPRRSAWSRSQAAPRARGCPRGSPPLAALPCPSPSRPGNPGMEVLGPRGERVSVAAFRFRQLLPQQLGSLRPTGPHLCSQRGAALGSCRCRQGPAVPASGSLEAHGSEPASWNARAGGERGLPCSSGGSGVVCSSSVRVCFLLCLRRPRWMRCDPGVQAWAVQIKSS